MDYQELLVLEVPSFATNWDRGQVLGQDSNLGGIYKNKIFQKNSLVGLFFRDKYYSRYENKSFLKNKSLCLMVLGK